MSTSARTISIIIDGSAAELDKALKNAIGSLRNYEKAIQGVSKTAISLNDRIIASNDKLIASYKKVSDSASGNSTSVTASADRAATAIRDQTIVVTDSAKLQADSYKKISAAADSTAASVQVSSDKQARSMIAASDASVLASKRHASAIKSSSGVVTEAGKKTTELGSKLSALSVPLLAVGAGSLYMGVKFQEAMVLLQTQAGYSEKSVKSLYKQVEAKAPSLARTPHEIAEALYHIASTGIPASQAMSVVTAAAQGANIGGSNLDATAKALANSMHALGLPASEARLQMSYLNEIVGAGDMHMEDLVGVLGTVLPSAKAAGLGLRDTGAAMDVLTASGIPATRAATGLRMMFMKLDAPTKASKEALEGIGLSQFKMAEDLQKPEGIVVALKDLKEHLDKSSLSAIEQKNLIISLGGGARSGAGGLLPLIQNLDKLEKTYKKIPEGAKSLDTMAKAEKAWESSSQSIIDHAKAGIADMGVSIGDIEMKALPTIKSFVDDVDGLVKDFTHLPSPIKNATIEALAFAAVLGPILKMSGRLITAGSAIGKMGKWMFSSSATSAASTAERGVLGGAIPGAGIGSNLVGASGSPIAVGSAMNPMAVAVEAGQFTALGSHAAASESTAMSAASVGGVSSKGVLLPPGVSAGGSAAVSAEESAVTGSAMSSVKSTIGSLATKLMKGGMIAGIGYMGAEMAGSMIGGKAGKDVSGIGSGAAIGAGIGTMIEPGLGTAIGAALGAAPGIVKAFEGGTQAEKRAGQVAGAHGAPHLGNKISEEIASEFKKEEDEIKKIISEHMKNNKAFTKADSNRVKELHEYYGEQAGSKLGEGEKSYVLGGTKNPGLESIVRTSEVDLAKLPPAGRLAFTSMIKQMVETLEKEGRLPKDSLQKVIDKLHPLLAGALPFAAGQSAKDFTKQFIANLGQQQMLAKVEEVSKNINQNWAHEFGLLPIFTHMSLEQISHNSVHDLNVLKGIMKNGTAEQRKEAEAQYKLLSISLGNYTKAAAKNVSAELIALGHQTGPLSLTAVNKILETYSMLPPGLKKQLDSAGGEVKKGIEKINSLTSVELKALGAASTISTTVTKALGSGFAGGGLVQLGNAGEAGRDSIPMNAGGMNIVAAPGEQVAVFTRHQQSVANKALAPMGGLPGLFRNVSTPHYMAQGGFVAEPGTNFSVGYEPKIVKDLEKLSAAIHKTIYGISGYRSPAHSIAVGGFGNDPHTEGKAADIGAGSALLSSMFSVPESALRAVGLYRPFYPPDAHEVNHVQLIGVPFGGSSGIPTGPGSAGAAANPVAAIWKAIKEPKINQKGLIGFIGQAVLHKVTQAANKYGKGHMPSSTTGAGSMNFSGVHGSGGSASANEKLGREMMLSAGWGASEWPSLQALWTQESGWNANSVNSSSGAYGIPQALGHGHPFNLGDARAQIAWGLNYIKGRYGSPSGAEAHEKAYNWYEQGGMINAAVGHLATVAHPKHPALKKTPKVKNIGKGKGPSSSIRTLLRNFGNIPGVPDLTNYEGQVNQLTSLSSLQSLLSSIEGLPDQTFISDEGMSFLKPTLQAGQTIHAGMTITDAQRQQQEAARRLKSTASSGEANPITEQGEILAWLGELPKNHLLTAGDVGILSGPGKAAGVKFKAGEQMGSASENVLGWELNKNEKLLKSEQALEGIAHNMGIALKKREKKIEEHAKAELKRYKSIKDHIKKLTTGQLKDRLKAAKDKSSRNELISDAQNSASLLTENIAEEKALPKGQRNEGQIHSWEADKRHISSYITSLRKAPSTVNAAYVALQKNELNNELGPIEENLARLMGSKTTIGKGGKWGEADKFLKSLESIRPNLATDISTQLTSTIPGFQIEINKIRSENKDAELKPAPKALEAGESSNESILNSILKEQLKQSYEANLIQGTELGAISNFIAQMPHFEKGGPVLQDGPAFLHEGEHVVPKGGSLVSAGYGHPPDINLNVEHNFQSAHGLIELIDSRVTHPNNMKVLSKVFTQRTQGTTTFRGH